jgi:hypothetical protein
MPTTTTEALQTTLVRLPIPLLDKLDTLKIAVRRKHGKNIVRAAVIRQLLEAVLADETTLDLSGQCSAEGMGQLLRSRFCGPKLRKIKAN